MQLILDNRALIQFALMAVVCLLALRKGGGPERGVALVLLSMFIIDRVYHLVLDRGVTLSSVDLFHAALDFAAAIALVVIALRANRMYTLWIAGLQLIALSAHLAREMTSGMTPIAYAILYILPSYFQILALAVGVQMHLKRQKRYGPYRGWRRSSAGSDGLRGVRR